MCESDNRILFSETNSIIVENMDLLTANSPFTHVDRIAQMNVMIYVLSGCIYVSEDDMDYEINPGEILLLKKGTHQYGKRVVQAGTTWIFAHFQVTGEVDAKSCISLPKFINIHDDKDIVKRIYNMSMPHQDNRALANSRRSMAFQELLLDIYEINENTAVAKPLGITEDIRKYLDENINTNISSDMVEKVFNLTYKYMNRVFKREYGESIMQYHSQKRINAVARKLRTTGDSITAIARNYGYEDSLYFSKVFKKQMGVSPREYRRNIISDF